MRIIIDIGHPAHVHYFKNLIRIMESKGHQFCIIARNKECTFQLLKELGIPYIGRGRGGTGYFNKFFYIFKAEAILLKYCLKFKPDLFLSFGSFYAAHVSSILRIQHVALDDTEHAKLDQLLFSPFTDTILNPSAFLKSMGKKQIRFNGYMELCYLHPKYYTPNPEILQLLGIKANEKYVIIRFISWNAAHDFHQHGMSLQFKIQLINELLKHSKIFISSEGPLPDEFQKYKLKVEPGKIHDVLSFASFYIGEGATMASECAMLGTPAIYINSLTAGTLEEQEKYGLIYGFQKTAGVMEKVFELFNKINLREEFQERRQHMLNEKIDVTAFLVWFIENYPASIKVLKTNPEYQYLFK